MVNIVWSFPAVAWARQAQQQECVACVSFASTLAGTDEACRRPYGRVLPDDVRPGSLAAGFLGGSELCIPSLLLDGSFAACPLSSQGTHKYATTHETTLSSNFLIACRRLPSLAVASY